MATLAKQLNPKIQVIGVEPEGANCMEQSLAKGEVICLEHSNTIADGTAVRQPGKDIFPYIQQNIDKVISVPDDDLIVAFLDGGES